MLRHVAILVRLRWKLVIATFSGKPGRKVAAILGFLVVIFWAAGLGMTTYGLVRHGGPALAEGESIEALRPRLVRIVFLGSFLIQLMTSVLSLSVSEFFDTARLMHLPVRARSIFFAMLASSVVSPGTLFFASPALGAVVALPGGAALFAFRLAVVLALVVFGQAVALFGGYLLLGALTRRRLRDAATIIGSVFGLGLYLLLRWPRQDAVVREWVTSGPLAQVLTLAPTTFFADLVMVNGTAAGPMRFVPALAALGVSCALGAWAFSRFYARASESSESTRPIAGAPAKSWLLPADLGAIGRQTLAIIWREPHLKAQLFQQMMILVVPFIVMQPGSAVESVAAHWSVPFFIVFSHGWLALSFLGMDGPGLKLLLQSPEPRGRILLGRALALGRLFAVIDLTLMALLYGIGLFWERLRQPGPRTLELAAACVVADCFLVAAGCFISVLAPSPLVRRSKHQRMRQEGCATNLGKVLVRMPVMVLAVIAGAVTGLPAVIGADPVWFWASIPAGLMLVVAMGTIGIVLGARRLVTHEERVLAALVDPGD